MEALFFFVPFLFVFLALGSFGYLAALDWYAANDGNSDSYYDAAKGIGVHVNPVIDFALAHITYIAWVLGLFLSMRLIHKRRLRTLITPHSTINWNKIFWGFGVFFMLILGTTLIDFALNPSDYELNHFKASHFFTLFLFVLILTPIQTTAEELFFRGYLMQLLGKKINNALFLSIVAGGIFGSLHFSNPEMEYSAFFVGSDYILSGLLWCYISAKTNSSELTIGAHAANNMFLGWFLTMDNTAFGNIPSLFVIKNIDPKITLLWTIFSLSTFTYLSIRKFGSSNRPIDRDKDTSISL
ncbi:MULTISPECIES: CPBP family intramembrane glutamic endopeptidase [unclassified Bacillus (in: firmicutes)]|uniref:CPBP family intramembrane glutamic endopeptidase n=1 Tax=unclassified Bacillus (in: firmicutes) TaxID=185979 RepID=UPI0008E36AE2|nr:MULTISPECIES: CPBP family intramembrane glutamic endopeptidase [unclassified Bacillus (in: firmicutes)]SFB13874.1 hypothetical protein SAMN02799634_106248 [Bacillus sp. UNCCL13]SFQ89882.1 hypothetical protein SAMN04488577_3571 [Bacillus sp. cl95]